MCSGIEWITVCPHINRQKSNVWTIRWYVFKRQKQVIVQPTRPPNKMEPTTSNASLRKHVKKHESHEQKTGGKSREPCTKQQ